MADRTPRKKPSAKRTAAVAVAGAPPKEVEVIDLTKDSPTPKKRLQNATVSSSHNQASTSGDGRRSRSNSSGDSIVLISPPVSAPKRKRALTQRENGGVSGAPVKKKTASPVEEPAFKCPVCLRTPSELKKADVQLKAPPCGHVLCGECIGSLNECPVCRKKFTKAKSSIRSVFL